MSGIDAISASRVLALRAQIVERNAALQKAADIAPAAKVGGAEASQGTSSAGFGSALDDALKAVNSNQNTANAMSEAYERGENVDVAAVMLARQKASIGFEATLQVRNKLLSAYKDIMSMPV